MSQQNSQRLCNGSTSVLQTDSGGSNPLRCSSPVYPGAHPHRGGGHPPAPSPLSTQERRRGACTAHTEISFLLLFGHINTSIVHVIFSVCRQAMRVRLPPPAPPGATGARGPDRTSFIYAAAVRSGTGFCSFSPAPVGIQAGQAISPSGRRGLGSRAVQPPGRLAQLVRARDL